MPFPLSPLFHHEAALSWDGKASLILSLSLSSEDECQLLSRGRRGRQVKADSRVLYFAILHGSPVQ